jgi:hypothetical protein
MLSKLYPKRLGPLRVGWGLRHRLGRDTLCFLLERTSTRPPAHTEPQQSVTSSAAAARLDGGVCHLPSSACTCAAERSAGDRSCAVLYLPSSRTSGHTLSSGSSASFMSSFWSMPYRILNFRSFFFAAFPASDGGFGLGFGSSVTAHGRRAALSCASNPGSVGAAENSQCSRG